MGPFWFFLLGLFAGLWFGKMLTDWRWASNAEEPQRIFHSGRLYKVIYDDIPEGGIKKGG